MSTVIKAYVNEKIKHAVAEQARKRGVSESKILNEALREHLRDKPKPGN